MSEAPEGSDTYVSLLRRELPHDGNGIWRYVAGTSIYGVGGSGSPGRWASNFRKEVEWWDAAPVTDMGADLEHIHGHLTEYLKRQGEVDRALGASLETNVFAPKLRARFPRKVIYIDWSMPPHEGRRAITVVKLLDPCNKSSYLKTTRGEDCTLTYTLKAWDGVCQFNENRIPARGWDVTPNPTEADIENLLNGDDNTLGQPSRASTYRGSYRLQDEISNLSMHYDFDPALGMWQADKRSHYNGNGLVLTS